MGISNVSRTGRFLDMLLKSIEIGVQFNIDGRANSPCFVGSFRLSFSAWIREFMLIGSLSNE